MPLIHNGRRLALLKRSIGKDHTNPRPLSPVQVAEHIVEMKNDLGNPSSTKTAQRLGVSTPLIDNFVGLLAVPQKYHNMLGWGKSDGCPIPWSEIRRAGPFLKSGDITAEELDVLLKGVINKQIPTSMIEDILYLKKKNPEKSIEKCCEEILNLVPKKIRYVVFVTDIDPDVASRLRKHTSAGPATPNARAELALAKSLGAENLEGVLIKDGKHIKVALTEKGRKNLDVIAKKEGVLVRNVVNHIISKNDLGTK